MGTLEEIRNRELIVAHSCAVGWNAAIEAAAKIAEENGWERTAARIRELDRSMQAIDD